MHDNCLSTRQTSKTTNLFFNFRYSPNLNQLHNTLANMNTKRCISTFSHGSPISVHKYRQLHYYKNGVVPPAAKMCPRVVGQIVTMWRQRWWWFEYGTYRGDTSRRWREGQTWWSPPWQGKRYSSLVKSWVGRLASSVMTSQGGCLVSLQLPAQLLPWVAVGRCPSAGDTSPSHSFPNVIQSPATSDES